MSSSIPAPSHPNVWAAFVRSLYTELRLLPCFGLFQINKKRPDDATQYDLQVVVKTFPASTSLSYFFSNCDQFSFRPISCPRGQFLLEVGYLSQYDVQQLYQRHPPTPPARIHDPRSSMSPPPQPHHPTSPPPPPQPQPTPQTPPPPQTQP